MARARVQAHLDGLGTLIGEEADEASEAAGSREPAGPGGSRASAGVHVYRGVPFAAPPVGEARFRPPPPPLPWDGVRDARAFASAAPQPLGQYGAAPVPIDEDCLYLNVHAPAEPGPHPVLVWVHGGGYTSGSSFDELQDGAAFAREGIVTVTVAYRLGALGLLHLRHLLGPDHATSSTNALLDVVAALRWVREHIAAFGGDPGRVTLGGVSAGAKLTATLLALPAARGLFHRAIVQSGGARTVRTVAEAERVTGYVLDALDLAPDRADRLAHVPVAELIAAQEEAGGRFPGRFAFRPVVDPEGPLPCAPSQAIRGDTPLLLGSNQDEEQLFAAMERGGRRARERDAEAADLANTDPAALPGLIAAYAGLHPELDPARRRIALLSAESYGIPTTRLAEAQAAAGGDAYLYRFRWAANAHPQHLGSPHGIDIPFVFGTFDTQFARWLTAGAPPSARALSRHMRAAWAAFVKGGAPAADGLPAWPPYTPDTRRTMVLDVPAAVVGDPDREERLAWEHAM